MYYKDSELVRADSNGRRLFLNTEFDKRTLKLKVNPLIATIERSKVTSDITTIIDQNVFDDKGNCALSKADFAACVANDEMNFNDFDFQEFRKVFTVLEDILSDE